MQVVLEIAATLVAAVVLTFAAGIAAVFLAALMEKLDPDDWEDITDIGFIERTQQMESQLYIYDVIDPKASNGYAWQLTERLNSGWELVEFRSSAALIRKRASLEEIDAWKRSIQDAVNKRARLS